MLKVGIVIRGTIEGFREIYVSDGFPEVDKASIIYDVRKLASSEKVIGQECYGISFSPNGKVFTIYRVMYDAPRSMAVGFLGVSLFVPFGIVVKGSVVLSILNTLMKEYMNYTQNNKLDDKIVNWGFIEHIIELNQQAFKLIQGRSQTFSSGTMASGVIFYKQYNLSKYFDDVFHSEYRLYRQILLIDEKDRGVDNILLIFKHSDDITNQIDVENPKYKLIINNDRDVDVLINSHKAFQNGEVKKNQQIIVEVKREYYYPDRYEGTYDDLIRKHPNIFQVDENERKIVINLPELSPKTKLLTLRITDGTNNLSRSDGISVTVSRLYSGVSENIINNQILFKGKEIGETWDLKINGGEKYKSITQKISLKHDINSIDIVLDKIIKEYPSRKEERPTELQRNTQKQNDNEDVPAIIVKKSWLRKNIFNIIFGVSVIIIALIVIGAVYVYFIDPDIVTIFSDNKTESNNSINTEDSYYNTLLESISTYSNGMELKLYILHQYENDLNNYQPSPTDNKYKETKRDLETALFIRDAINKENKRVIDSFANTRSLPENQLKILKLISGNLDYFNLIKGKEDLSLSQIKSRLEQILHEEKENAKSQKDSRKVKSITQEPTPKNNASGKNNKKVASNKGKYRDDEFWDKIFLINNREDLDAIEENKLTPDQKELFNFAKNKYSIFKSLLDKHKYQLDYTEFRKKVLNTN